MISLKQIGWVAVAGLLACAPPRAESIDPEFDAYWYAGKAEITSYTLEQARYGEIHRGTAALIFVTEDFSREKQVKLDAPGRAGKDAVKVLKLNFTKKFNTGVYPYSMMSSIFMPVAADDDRALKITTSSQEWCGHTFTQLNRKRNGYDASQFSYFESEGDVARSIPDAIPEDQLWTMIRLDPESLPTGRVTLVPGTMYQRLRHTPLEPRTATASLASAAGGTRSVYKLEYPEDGRTLTIEFERSFPYTIESWEESYRGLTTRATKIERKQLDYWNRNSNADLPLRRELGLD